MASYEEIKKRVKQYGVSGTTNNSTSGSGYKGSDAYEKIKERVKNNGLSFDDIGVDENYINTYISDVNNYLSTAQDEYGKLGWNNASSTYDSRQKSFSDLYNKSENIRTWLNANKNRLDEETYKSLYSSFEGASKSLTDVRDVFENASKYYGQWETEDDYNQYLKQQEEREVKLSFDLETGAAEIADLEAKLAKKEELLKKREQLIANHSVNGVKQVNAELEAYKDIDSATLAQKKVYYREAETLQNATKLHDGALKSEDFEQYAQTGLSMDQPNWMEADSSDRSWIDKLIHGSKEVTNVAAFVQQNMKKYEAEYGLGEGSGRMAFIGTEWEKYTWMTDDEVKVYSYYIAKGDKNAADTYLASIEESLAYRQAEQQVKNVGDSAFLKGVFAVGSGLEQWATGVKNLFNDEEYYAPTSTQIASQTIRENLDGVGGFLYDLGTTVGNQLPSILVGSITGSVGGLATMGVSVYGNSYAEMINLGYNKQQANTYATLTTAAELGLQSVLGGYKALGGKLSNGLTEFFVSKVDSALAKFAIRFAGNALAEGIEESLQSVLEPTFKNFATGSNTYTVDWDEVIYSGLLGAASAGLLEGAIGNTVSGVKNVVNTYKTGEQIKNVGAVDRLTKLGTTFSADSVAHKLAGKVNENTGAYTIGRLFNKIGATLTEANKADIVKSLEEKGMSTKDAKTIAKWLGKAVEGEYFTDKQIAVLENNDVVTETFKDVIINQNSTVNQRIKAYNEAVEMVKNGGNNTTTPNTGAVVAESSSATDKASKTSIHSTEGESSTRGSFKTSEDGKTTITNENGDVEEVSVKEISSIKDGVVSVRLDNGKEVDAREVNFSSQDEALIYEAVADMNIDTANDMIQGFKAINNSPDTRLHMPLNEYIKGYQEAHRYGYYGYPVAEMSKDGFSASLPEEQRKIAYNRGRIDAVSKVDSRQSKIDKIKEKATVSKTEKVAPKKYDGETHISEVNTKGMTERQKASVGALKVLHDTFGINVYLFESPVVNGKRVGKNGYYDPSDKSIHIDTFAGANGAQVMLFTAAHELTHLIRDISPAKFKVFADFLLEQYGKKGVPVEELVQKQIEKAANKGRTIDYDTAYEEVVADACETMLTDSNAIEKIGMLKAKDKTLWQKIKDFIKNLVARIKKAYEGLTPDSDEANYVREMVDAAEQLQALWTDALIDAGESYSAVNDMVQVDVDSESASPMFSERTWTESEYVKAREEAAEKLAKALDVSKKKALAYIDDVNGIAKMIADNRTRLDYEASPFGSAFVSNVEYGGSFDFTTLCKKRRLYTGTFSEIQKRLHDVALTPDDILTIRNMMIDKGIEATCGLCYVEGSRANMGKFAQEFIRLYKRDNPNAWIPKMADVNTPDGVESMKINHPEAYEQYEYFWNHYGKLNDSDPALFASQQKPKLYEARKEYKGEILKSFKDDSTVEKKNLNGGIRMQSFSDFEVVHMIDTMQIIMDMSRVGLAGQAYTKVPEFADTFGNTGLKINLSLIAKGVDAEGNLIFDDREGMPHETAFGLRDKYSANVGTIIVTFTDAQLLAAMADPRIDYIIPFHRSQWKKGQYGAMGLPKGTKDYTFMQNEKLIKQTYHEYRGKQVKDKAKNYMPNEYWDFSKSGKENAEAYLKMCAENNKRPKFYKLLDYDGKGTYSLKKDGSTDGYWKVLIDFKMYDNNGVGSPQNAVAPNFSMNEAKNILNEYRGGHQSYPVANDVVDAFVDNYNKQNKTKYSDRDSEGNTLTKEQQEFFKDSKVRDEKGNLQVVYHGTETGGFTVFGNSKSGEGYWFADKTTAESYIDVSSIGEEDWTGGLTSLYTVYLNAKNPLVVDAKGYRAAYMPTDGNPKINGGKFEHIDNIAVYAKENGYDGLIVKNVKDYGRYTEENLGEVYDYNLPEGTVYVVFDSNQIKNTTNKKPTSDQDIRYSDRVTDQETLDFLENQEHVTVYRAMQLIDGKLYPPMNAYTYDENGKKVLMTPSEIGAWEQSVERPDLIDKKTGKFKLDKGKVDGGKRGTTVPAAYNPYIHTSLSMLNDQFTSAYTRSNLVVVKGVVPKSELTSGYKAQYAKDAVGETEWHSGVVSSQLPESRKVILSRWFKPVEIMDNDVVAKNIKKMLGNTGIEIPYNVVSPSLRRSLEKIGVPIGEGRGIRNLPKKSEVKYSDRGYAPTFYSQMGKVVEGMKQDKFGASSVIPMLRGRGVKAEEIRWSGISTWLEGKKSVTKQELLDFIASSQLQVGEQMSDGDIDLRYDAGNHSYTLYDKDGNAIDTFTYNEFLDGYVAESDEEIYSNAIELEESLREEYGVISAPRWSQYKLDGGENYREIVFTMPNSSYSNRAMKAHWGQDAEGVLVHARIQDFDVNDKKMLFIEELQSDWHNEGHAKGYSNKEYEDAVATHDDLYNKYKKLDLAFHKYVRSNDFRTDPEDVRKKKHDWLRGKVDTAQKKYLEAEKVVNSLKEKGAGDTEDAPFKDTYHEFVLKRLLRMAAEEGYDSIGWTIADTQSKRWSYDYEKAYQIEYDQDMPKFLSKYGRQWGAKVGKTVIENLFGESVYTDKANGMVYTEEQLREKAKQIVGKEHNVSETDIKDIDISITGAVFVETESEVYMPMEVTKEKGTPIWSMDLTDSMKNSVLNEGQVLYSDRKEVIDDTVDKAINQKGILGVKYNQVRISRFPTDVSKMVADASEGRIDLSDKYIAINGADVWHEYERHNDSAKEASRGQLPFTNETIKEAIGAIYAPDMVECLFSTGENPTQRRSFAYAKKSPKGYYIVVEAVGGKNNPNVVPVMLLKFSEVKWENMIASGKTLGEVLYENDAEKLASLDVEFNKKNRVTVAQFASKEAIANTPHSPRFIDSVAQNPESVNQKNSDRDPDGLSNRSLLANALESAAQNDIERNKLAQYKEKINLINAEEQKLHDLKEQIKELSFAKGRKDTDKIKSLQFEANQTANRINTYDRQLLTLEASKPLKSVLEREKQLAYKKAEQRGKDALAAYRERTNRVIVEQMKHYQESRAKGVENRKRTEMRHKIKGIVSKLNDLLLHGSKERNIKLGLQEAVASALEAINMDTVSAEARIAKLKEELVKAKTPEKIQEISRKIDHIKQMGESVADKLEALRKAYSEIKRENNEGFSAQFKEEASLIHDRIESVIKEVGETPIRDMSLSQLQSVYDMYSMVFTTIRNANNIWREGKLIDLQTNASTVMSQFEKIPLLKQTEAAFKSKVREFTWNEMTPYYAFERLGSEALTQYYWDLMKAQGVYAQDGAEAKNFASATRDKYGYSKWNLDKVYEFECKDGRTFATTLKHLLSIYAYSKREQALAHMETGGFFHNDKSTFRKKGGVFELIRRDEAGYKIDADILAEIKGALTKEQIGYVDEMQEYLTKMGEKGNEVTRIMWGIDIFKEKVYFPLKSKDDFIKRSTETAQAVSLKNDGMTKETVAGANNPIVLEAFDDVWASHVNRMSQYHAFVIPIDNLNKILQYGTWAGTDSMSVSTMITARFGSEAKEYLSQFVKDLNGGVMSQGAKNPLAGFFTKFKKTAVGASLSTVIQQPTAILRAMAIIDAKYFVGKPNIKSLGKKWEEVKKYAPIAIIKEIGGFDAGGGKSMERWINSDTVRGVDKIMNTVDDISMKGAEIADQLGWTTIWEAIKRETVHNYKNLNPNSEEFLQKVGERFEEVIAKTQVYDSTLSRSGYMRSKNEGVKMLTAFMGEPTLSINMMFNAILQAIRGGKGAKVQAIRTIGSVYASIIAASALSSLIYALRDDDEDESYAEKYMQVFGGEVLTDIILAPVTSLPAVKDIISIFQGWDVERTDVAVFKDIKDAIDGLDSDNKSTYRKIEDFAGAIASIFGLPLKNLLRTGREIYNGINDISDGIEGGNIGAAFIEGFTNEERTRAEKLYEAMLNGDKARLEVYKKQYKDNDALLSAFKGEVKKRYLSGELNSSTATKYLIKYGGMDEDDAYWRLEEWDYEAENGKDAEYKKYNDFYDAVTTGTNLKSVITKYTDNGVDKKTLASQITSHFKPLYKKMSNYERASLKGYLLNAYAVLGYDRADKSKDIDKWLED